MNEKFVELFSAYRQTFDRCLATIDTVPDSQNGGPANPLLIKPPEGYLESGLRVMYFGQETNGYEGKYINSKGIEHLLGVYERFTTEKDGFPAYRGQFWNAVRHFQKSFYKHDSTTQYVWNNLIKIGKDWSKGRPPFDVLEWQRPWIHVVKKEMQVFDPHVVIFFSGPGYDDMLKRNFEDVRLRPVDGFSQRKLSVVESRYLPAHSFRTYHPGYLYRHGFYDVFDAIYQAVICSP